MSRTESVSDRDGSVVKRAGPEAGCGPGGPPYNMPDEEQERRKRAEELRQQIRNITSEAPPDSGPEMKPGESPKEYMERRQREMEKKKPADLNG